MKRFLATVLCLTMLFVPTTNCLNAETNISEDSVTREVFAETNTGGVVGYRYDGVNNFYAIPYAKAERFMEPTAVEPWSGYLPCMVIGEVAPQGKTTKNNFDGMNYTHVAVENEEKMLNLNIHTTDTEAEVKKPVVFWIHGGGYKEGSSVEYTFYDGGNLAKYGDVVFVSPNHRLNVLGYLDLSAYGDEYKNSGNMGIVDLIFALQWVKDNIESFGGDPNNITIVGQSGGGSKVTTLLGVPSAKGLFKQAVCLSGGSAKVTKTTKEAQADAKKVLDILGITVDELEKIKTIPYDTLLAAYREAGVAEGPVVDGDFYPDGTYAAAKDIPLMVGTVLGEFSTNFGALLVPSLPSKEVYNMNKLDIPEEMVLGMLTEKYGENAQMILDAFKQAYPEHAVAEVLYTNNREVGMLASNVPKAMAGYGGTVYQYVQAYVYPMFGGVVPIHTASCIPFWFHNTDKVHKWTAGDEEMALKVSNEMASALVSFAYTGNPSTPTLKWEKWDPEKDAIMIFDRVSGMKYHHDDELFKLINEGGNK